MFKQGFNAEAEMFHFPFAVEIHHEFVKRAVAKRVALSAEKVEIENGEMCVNSLFFQFRDQEIRAIQIERIELIFLL